MDEKNKKLIKIDKMLQRDYPFIGMTGTYHNWLTEEKSLTEAEIEVMKEIEQNKSKENEK